MRTEIKTRINFEVFLRELAEREIKILEEIGKPKKSINGVLERKKEWNALIDRINEERIIKIARDSSPLNPRSQNEPRKRWIWSNDSIKITILKT